MKKWTMIMALVLSGTLGASAVAHADDFNCKITVVAERVSQPGVPGHSFAVACENGRGAVSPQGVGTSSAMVDRFVSVMLAAFLSNRSVYIDVGNTCTHPTDCPAIGWAVNK